MRMTFLSILGEPGTFDPGVYDGIPGGANECQWILQSFGYLEGVEITGVKVAEGEAIPSPATADAFVLGGSYNSVHDGFGWQESIMRWLSELAEAGKPLLGICGGQQLLNVALGGTLIQHIPDEVPGALAHEQPNPRDQAGHEVQVTANSLLHRICGAGRLAVNSAHHQAVGAPGDGVRVNAVAPDGVIEGIEAPDRRFCLGVQWHPAYAVSAGDPAIFAALIAAAQRATGYGRAQV